ncbi:hypothetical protein AXE65_11685 [Ventosimonas gracilis]|uniref:Uncharacterized protein n=1 Tax=Ventosimonas gracilis TaxID=1680762 RepID=A0A139SW66_9GAMM|nr:hypothetical protein [Ventosimonas gracilis]KXU38847.1 hypothetical protein AXE65_11685 [Ventosimonas gracilis]
MNTEIIDCVCFRLPKPDKITPILCRAGYLYIKMPRTIGKGDCYISLRVLEKTEEDRKRKDFEELFRHSGHFPNKRGAAIDQYEIGKHQLLLTIGSIKKPLQCILAGVIDLDKNHYLHTSITFSIDDACYPPSENIWETEKLRREETVATLQYFLALLENLQLNGNYSQALQQVRMEEEQKQQAEQQKALQEKLDKAAQPIDCAYFSLPSTENLTEVRFYSEQMLLYFARNDFSGVIDIRLHRYPLNAKAAGNSKLDLLKKLLPGIASDHQKNQDFLRFFRTQVLPKDNAGKTLDTLIESISSGCRQGYLALHLNEDKEFQWIAAIDVDDDHYLSFIATYQKNGGNFTSTDNQAAADIYSYLQSVLHSLHIKVTATTQDLQKPNKRT